jgi:UDP-N-acetylglucosamine 2-epimerase (hydrolysing)
MTKKILFLTGTRADFGKLKSLINKVEYSNRLEAHIFVTGMHMISKYGMTAREVEKSNYESIFKYINQNPMDTMDIILAKTINGLSDYIKEIKPDLIVVHGDRVEAMAGAIVGALNNILVAHIEGGEVSGTIDELIRHSVSKMSHLHFVSNEKAKKRLLQLGEDSKSIFVIGSPDLDLMSSNNLPSLDVVKAHYKIGFEEYAVFMYHPVTTDLESLHENIKSTIDALITSEQKYIVIYPNNDNGSEIIINEISRLENNKNFLIFPSIRFENFLTLLKYSKFMIGNSSAGIREVPFYGIPSINLGNRQNNRSSAKSIFNVTEKCDLILKAIELALLSKFEPLKEFGNGNSDNEFERYLLADEIWNTNKQKLFVDVIN